MAEFKNGDYVKGTRTGRIYRVVAAGLWSSVVKTVSSRTQGRQSSLDIIGYVSNLNHENCTLTTENGLAPLSESIPQSFKSQMRESLGRKGSTL